MTSQREQGSRSRQSAIAVDGRGDPCVVRTMPRSSQLPQPTVLPFSGVAFVMLPIHSLSPVMCLVTPSCPQVHQPEALQASGFTVCCLLGALASPSCWHNSCFEMRLRPLVYRRSFSHRALQNTLAQQGYNRNFCGVYVGVLACPFLIHNLPSRCLTICSPHIQTGKAFSTVRCKGSLSRR